MDIFDLTLWKGFPFTETPFIIDQICIDSRKIVSPNCLFVALPGLKCDGHTYVEDAYKKGAVAALVKSNYIPSFSYTNFTLIKVDDPLFAFQEIAKTYRLQFNAKVIAIVGSHGKTMVKDLLHQMVATEKKVISSPGSFNSQIGVPLSLLNISKDTEIALIEGAISKKNEMNRLLDIIIPDACVITHLGKKHLATIGNIETFSEEILKIATETSNLKWTLLPQNSLTHPFLGQISCPVHFWNIPSSDLPHAEIKDSHYNSTTKYRIKFPYNNYSYATATSGFFYFMDLLNITIKTASLIGIDFKAIANIIENYAIEPTRTEICKSTLGTTIINESYSTNVHSVETALKHFKLEEPFKRKFFVFGGIKENKYDSFECRLIADAIVNHKIDVVSFVGENNYTEIKEFILKKAPQTKIFQHKNHPDAFQNLSDQVTTHDVIVIAGEKKQPLNSILECFNDSISTNQCFINLAAIESNLLMLRQKLKQDTRFMVMVKAFAYGTDEVRMAKFLSTRGVDILGVSYVDEAIVLKRAGINQSLFVINAAPFEARKIIKWNLEIGVSEMDLILAVEKEASLNHTIIKMHLHIDTGMCRLGCRKEDALKLALYIQNSKHLLLEGLMTHFASSDCVDDNFFTMKQANDFNAVIEELKQNGISPPWIHASNSSAVIRFDFPGYNMVRVGLAAYGLYSSDDAKNKMDLRLALSLVSRIVGINTCHTGETVSYGRSYKIEKDNQKIAVLPIGYFDGLHRNYSGKGYVLIRGQKAPMVGKICMDYMMVDVSEIRDVSIGDPVLIFGEDEFGQYLPPENLATQGNSIIHELITCLGPRIQRVFIHEESNNKR